MLYLYVTTKSCNIVFVYADKILKKYEFFSKMTIASTCIKISSFYKMGYLKIYVFCLGL